MAHSMDGRSSKAVSINKTIPTMIIGPANATAFAIGAVFVMTIRYMGKERIEESLPHISAPVLVVRGSRDPIISQRWAEEAASLLPKGRLAVIDGQTHTITVAGPEALAQVVVPFLKGTA